MIDLARYPDPRAALEAALGRLVLFEVLTGSEPAADGGRVTHGAKAAGSASERSGGRG